MRLEEIVITMAMVMVMVMVMVMNEVEAVMVKPVLSIHDPSHIQLRRWI